MSRKNRYKCPKNHARRWLPRPYEKPPSALQMLKERAKQHHVRVIEVYGLTYDNLPDAFDLLAEFAESAIGQKYPVYDAAVSPETGIKMLLRWTP